MSTIPEGIRENPIIAAVLNENDLLYAMQTRIKTVFLLCADIFNIKSCVDMVKANGKNILIHMDFLEGFAKDKNALDYIAKVIRPDGIICTISEFTRYALENEIFVIQRFFVVDSLSFKKVINETQQAKPDMIEIMPAIIPKIIGKFSERISLPVIAGGLIETRKEIIEVLKAGASGVSTGKKELWDIEILPGCISENKYMMEGQL